MRNSRISRRTTACIIPATGVRPPLLMFVIVLAIAPVAGIPPKIGVTIFATPSAINSVFELWWSLIIPSATVAESNDSIAPSAAIVTATGNRFLMASQLSAGISAFGSCELMEKRSPIVSILSMPRKLFKHHTPMVTSIIATNEPGIFFEILGVTAIIMTLVTLTMKFHQLTVLKCLKYSIHLPMKSPGTVSPPNERPKTSVI